MEGTRDERRDPRFKVVTNTDKKLMSRGSEHQRELAAERKKRVSTNDRDRKRERSTLPRSTVEKDGRGTEKKRRTTRSRSERCVTTGARGSSDEDSIRR